MHSYSRGDEDAMGADAGIVPLDAHLSHPTKVAYHGWHPMQTVNDNSNHSESYLDGKKANTESVASALSGSVQDEFSDVSFIVRSVYIALRSSIPHCVGTSDYDTARSYVRTVVPRTTTLMNICQAMSWKIISALPVPVIGLWPTVSPHFVACPAQGLISFMPKIVWDEEASCNLSAHLHMRSVRVVYS